jgi:hypothetical protein
MVVGMSFFSKKYVPELLVGPQKEGDRGWVAAVLPQGKQAPGDSLSLSEAWIDNDLCASFVFSAIPPTLNKEEDARFLVKAVQTTLIKRGVSRGIVWLQEKVASVQNSSSLPSLGFNINTSKVNYALSMSLGTDISFILDNGMLISLNEEKETLCFDNSAGGTSYIHFDGPAAPLETTGSGTIAFSGTERGCIAFDMYIAPGFLKDTWFWGFQFQVPQTNKDNGGVITEWLPFLEEASDKSDICFSCVFDPSDVFNRMLARRTLLKFTGQTRTNGSSKNLKDSQQTSFKSYYRTTTGAKVTLYPIGSEQAEPSDMVAGLAFAQGRHLDNEKHNIYVTLLGDFAVSAPTAPSSQRAQIMCGLQGNEYISLEPVSKEYAGDRLRFIGSQPSYGYCYPLPQASPVGPPVDLTKQLLDDTFITSWATIVSAQGTSQKPVYVAQPKGAPLYGQDPVINQAYKNLLGAMHPGIELDEDVSCFPMIPYAGVSPGDGQFAFDDDLIGLFERQFLSPTRRAKIGTGKPVPSALGHRPLLGGSGTEFNVTTPSGQLVTINDKGEWTKILLAQLTHPKESQLYFQDPRPELKQAFQTTDLMLVVANPKFLGTMGGNQGASFNNTLNIENWVMAAQVGEHCRYGDYTNVIIVKGVKGKLFDPQIPTSENLVANPAKWTQKGDFAARNGKEDELVPLSQWLFDYCKDAAEKTGSDSDALYFAKFNKIVQDENWTGILVLRATIATLPEQMKGITAGINDPSQFYAHHFAIETGQISHDQNGVMLKDSTSVYGLIYYEDPAYDSSKPEQPVPPDAGSVYDFHVLTLKVLFENSALKQFQSYAQLTLNELFGSSVSKMGEAGNPYNTIVLRGTYQNNNGQPVYSLGSVGDSTFYFNSNVLNKVEVTGAQMSTRDAGADGDSTASWFALNGFIDFKVIQQSAENKTEIFDIFSFGNRDNEDLPRQGLSFSNLGLQMSYPTDSPEQKTFEFKTGEIRFDPATSTPRDGSLFVNFALQLEGLVAGSKDSTPSQQGYLPVITDFRLGGVEGSDGGDWYGLRFRLDMGTPGELAGKVSLTSHLLTAWSPASSGDSYKALVGIELPGTGGGAKLIDLQNVLKLSIGQIRLTRDDSKNSFLLMFTEIALKFLGLLKIPPSGSTLFYLFGNPESGGKPSGLGWYAMYRTQRKDQNEVTTSSPAGQQTLRVRGGRDASA